MSHPGFASLDPARRAVLSWAASQHIPLHSIEFVATFEDWDDGIGVWVFYETNAQLEQGFGDGTSERVKARVVEELRSASYPFAEFPNLVFEFDSHENVVLNFQGNYFYRLR